MGLPITNYTVLKAIADGVEKQDLGIERNFEMQMALEQLSEFSVYAFILHDPIEHPNFHQHLDRYFEDLHYNSGEHLVFFGLVDSPQNYCLEGNRIFYKDVRDSLSSYEKEESSEIDQSYTAFAIAKMLKIDPDTLPVLVVTHDLRLKSFNWYKTCPEKLETQMSRLSTIANRMNVIKRSNSISLEEKQNTLNELLDKYDIDLCNGKGQEELNVTIARALSDVISCLIESEQQSEYFRRKRDYKWMSQKNIRKTLLKLNEDLVQYRQGLIKVDPESFESSEHFRTIEELSVNLGIFLNLLSTKEKNHYEIFLNRKWYENNSWRLIQTGLGVLSYLESRQEYHDFDFSPSAICFGKMFEQEINYSLVHWIRKQHSIELPKYYNKYQPNVQVLITPKMPNGRPVNFNNVKNGSWSPPELGGTLLVAEKNLSREQWKEIRIENPTLLFSEWNNIRRIRNKAVHTGSVTRSDVDKLLKSIINLESNHTQKILANMKKELRSVN